ncbi:MAG: DUF4416 domain-containing protein [Candidatus Cloacimonadota bacterium]|nr:MAG: DUF4416 domain-containing protein [Candidatus Cloacimonadota bacterium]
MKPTEPLPVKLFCGILFADENVLNKTLNILTQKFGKIDFQSKFFPFSITDYYNSEMGNDIRRMFCSFEELINPSLLAEIKLECNETEEKFTFDGKRKINLDPGYLDYNKVVLASAKYNAQKIYLKSGIYADITLFYEKGKFVPADWAFPDFKLGIYENAFLQIRSKYKLQLKNINR